MIRLKSSSITHTHMLSEITNLNALERTIDEMLSPYGTVSNQLTLTEFTRLLDNSDYSLGIPVMFFAEEFLDAYKVPTGDFIGLNKLAELFENHFAWTFDDQSSDFQNLTVMDVYLKNKFEIYKGTNNLLSMDRAKCIMSNLVSDYNVDVYFKGSEIEALFTKYASVATPAAGTTASTNSCLGRILRAKYVDLRNDIIALIKKKSEEAVKAEIAEFVSEMASTTDNRGTRTSEVDVNQTSIEVRAARLEVLTSMKAKIAELAKNAREVVNEADKRFNVTREAKSEVQIATMKAIKAEAAKVELAHAGVKVLKLPSRLVIKRAEDKLVAAQAAYDRVIELHDELFNPSSEQNPNLRPVGEGMKDDADEVDVVVEAGSVDSNERIPTTKPAPEVDVVVEAGSVDKSESTDREIPTTKPMPAETVEEKSARLEVLKAAVAKHVEDMEPMLSRVKSFEMAKIERSAEQKAKVQTIKTEAAKIEAAHSVTKNQKILGNDTSATFKHVEAQLEAVKESFTKMSEAYAELFNSSSLTKPAPEVDAVLGSGNVDANERTGRESPTTKPVTDGMVDEAELGVGLEVESESESAGARKGGRSPTTKPAETVAEKSAKLEIMKADVLKYKQETAKLYSVAKSGSDVSKTAAIKAEALKAQDAYSNIKGKTILGSDKDDVTFTYVNAQLEIAKNAFETATALSK